MADSHHQSPQPDGAKPVLIRHFAPGDLEKVKKLAREGMRSVSAQVAYMVHKALEEAK